MGIGILFRVSFLITDVMDGHWQFEDSYVLPCGVHPVESPEANRILQGNFNM